MKSAPLGALFDLTSVVDGEPRTRFIARVNLAWAINFRLRIIVHFFPVGNPTGKTSDGKHHREHVCGNSHRVIKNARIEIHIRIEFPFDKVVVFEGGIFEFGSDVQQRIANMFAVKNRVHKSFQNFCARVVVFVNAMPEAVKFEWILTVFCTFDDLLDCETALVNFHQRFEGGLVGATVERSPQSADASADTRIQTRLRTADHTDC